MRHHLARALRAMAAHVDPQCTVTVVVTGDEREARRAILIAETAIRRHARGYTRREAA